MDELNWAREQAFELQQQREFEKFSRNHAARRARETAATGPTISLPPRDLIGGGHRHQQHQQQQQQQQRVRDDNGVHLLPSLPVARAIGIPASLEHEKSFEPKALSLDDMDFAEDPIVKYAAVSPSLRNPTSAWSTAVAGTRSTQHDQLGGGVPMTRFSGSSPASAVLSSTPPPPPYPSSSSSSLLRFDETPLVPLPSRQDFACNIPDLHSVTTHKKNGDTRDANRMETPETAHRMTQEAHQLPIGVQVFPSSSPIPPRYQQQQQQRTSIAAASGVQADGRANGQVSLLHDSKIMNSSSTSSSAAVLSANNHQKPHVSEWSCTQCTYINALRAIECEMCGAKAPVRPIPLSLEDQIALIAHEFYTQEAILCELMCAAVGPSSSTSASHSMSQQSSDLSSLSLHQNASVASRQLIDRSAHNKAVDDDVTLDVVVDENEIDNNNNNDGRELLMEQQQQQQQQRQQYSSSGRHGVSSSQNLPLPQLVNVSASSAAHTFSSSSSLLSASSSASSVNSSAGASQPANGSANNGGKEIKNLWARATPLIRTRLHHFFVTARHILRRSTKNVAMLRAVSWKPPFAKQLMLRELRRKKLSEDQIRAHIAKAETRYNESVAADAARDNARVAKTREHAFRTIHNLVSGALMTKSSASLLSTLSTLLVSSLSSSSSSSSSSSLSSASVFFVSTAAQIVADYMNITGGLDTVLLYYVAPRINLWLGDYAKYGDARGCAILLQLRNEAEVQQQQQLALAERGGIESCPSSFAVTVPVSWFICGPNTAKQIMMAARAYVKRCADLGRTLAELTQYADNAAEYDCVATQFRHFASLL